MNTNIIPKGHYCYTPLKYENESLKIKKCPYYVNLEIYTDNGTFDIPYCLFLNNGSIPNGMYDNQFQSISDHFGVTDDEIYDIFSLPLLWDQVKECKINID